MFFHRNKNKSDKKKLKDQLKSIKVDTFTKALVLFITVVALIDLQLSYILAFLNKIQIAEELSKQVCTTILGVAFVYMIRAYYDSKAEHANESVKRAIEQEIANKVSSVLIEANATEDNTDPEYVVPDTGEPSLG